MHGDSVDMAPAASLEEVLHPGDAHGRAAIGDCGRNQLRLSCEGLHVQLSKASGFGGRNVELEAEIRLAESAKEELAEKRR